MRVWVECELGGAVVVLGGDMMDDAVDGKGALEEGRAGGRWVSGVVDGDAGPPSLAGRTDTVRAPDAPGIVLEERGVGVVVVDDLAAKDEDVLPVYGLYPIKNRAPAIGGCLVVLDVGSGVEKVVVGGEMEMECVGERGDGDADGVRVFEAGVGVDGNWREGGVSGGESVVERGLSRQNFEAH